MPNEIIVAHKHSIRHRDELKSSDICGCFYCLDTFDYRTISSWADGGDTAICPRCGIDSVIGSASGYPAGDVDFLRAMRAHWF